MQVVNLKLIFAVINLNHSMFNKILFSLSLAVILSFSAFAQEEKPSFGDRLFFGGNVGLQFGNTTYIDVSPIVGYKITEKFHAGIGATYIYFKYKDLYYKYETSIYGGNVFSRYFITENLFAHTAVELLNLEVPAPTSVSNDNFKREFITNVFVGGGYAQPIGSNVSLVLMILFNLTEEQYSPYQNPVISIGVNAGF
jgi:hypothetical protein